MKKDFVKEMEDEQKKRYTISMQFVDHKRVTPQVVDHYLKDGYLVIHSHQGGEAILLKDLFEWEIIRYKLIK